MKTRTLGLPILLVVALTGCGQQLVEFRDAGADLAAHDLAVTTDLSLNGADLTANAGDDLNASGDDLAATSDDLLVVVGDDGGQGPVPMVIDESPDNLAIGVPTFRRPTARFNLPMNPATIDTTSFTLRELGSVQPLTGLVDYDVATQTAIFRPDSALLVDTFYVATITTAARSATGTPLALDFSWSFRTATQACGMAPVILGAAGSFGAFAGTTITNSGPTIVNGNLGVSPGTATAITGFGPSPGVGGPGIVNGTQRTDPDPAAAQARADINTAYDDAKDRSLCFVTIADGELGGTTLTPGLYRSGVSSFAITAADLTLDAQGDSEAVFIIQTSSSTLTIANGRQVILAGGAKANNVFWSVGTQATIGTTARVKGTILAGTSISLDTGATLEGRALANAAVTLLSNTITVPSP